MATIPIFSSGTSTNLTLYDRLAVQDEACVISTTIKSGGYLSVSHGGLAIKTTVSSYGALAIEAGGLASDSILSGGGMYCGGGGSANNTNILSNGILNVYSEGKVSNTIIDPWGTLNAYSGGTAYSTTLNGGQLKLSNGGSAIRTNISGGVLKVSSGGYVSSATVYPGGTISIDYGGLPYNIVENGGYVSGERRVDVGYAHHCFSNIVLNKTTATVHSGTTAVTTTMNSGGQMYVFSGGTANKSIVNSAGLLCITGGVAYSTTLNFSGNMSVLNGGSAFFTIVSSGTLYIESGGQAGTTTLGNEGDMRIHGGGVAVGVTINSGGRLFVSSRGYADSTTVNPGGCMYINDTMASAPHVIENGGCVIDSQGAYVHFIPNSFSNTVLYDVATVHSGTAAVSTVLSSGGSIVLFFLGSANNTIIRSSGAIVISSNGMARDTIVSSGGFLHISEGGIAISTIVSSNGTIRISSGGKASKTTISSGGRVEIWNGGRTDSTAISSGGTLYVSNGGSANNTSVCSGGCLRILAGGSATEICLAPWDKGIISADPGVSITYKDYTGVYLLSAGGIVSTNNVMSGKAVPFSYEMHVLSGGTAIATTITSGGSLYVSKSGLASNTTINSSGRMSVFSGGTANSTTINANGRLDVFDGGIANSTTINSYGCVEVLDGGIVKNAKISAYGYIDVSSRGIVSGATVNSNADIYLSAGAIASSTRVNSGGAMTVFGYAENTAVYGRNVSVCYGGLVSGTTVGSTGRVCICNGGRGNATSINSGGYMIVFSGGTAVNTTINSYGSMTIAASGSASDTIVEGRLDVSSGAFASHVIENGGFVNIANGAIVTFSFNTFNDKNLNSVATVHSATTANRTNVNSGGNLLIIGGFANSTSINASGYMEILDGSANQTTVNTNGNMLVSSGGTADSTTVLEGGNAYARGGGSLNNTIVNDYGNVFIENEGSASNTAIDSGGCLTVCDPGAIADRVWNSGGRILISNRGTVSNAVVDMNGQMDISQGAVAYNASALNGGSITLLYGGSAGAANIYDSGSMDILSGGTAFGTIVDRFGSATVSNGGIASITSLTSGGQMGISIGGSAYGTTVDSGARLKVSGGGLITRTTIFGDGNLYILSGGSATDTTMSGPCRAEVAGVANNTIMENGASLLVSASGHLSGTTVNSGARLTLASLGSITDTTTNSGGSLLLSSGGEMHGTLQIESGAIVSAYNGAKIIFELENRLPGNDVLINDWSLINGGANPDYYVSIKGSQGVGIYRLVDGASGFGKTITIIADDVEIGTVSTGETVTYSNKTYSLELSGGGLRFRIQTMDTIYVFAGETSTGIILTDKNMHVLSGGIASNTTVNQSKAIMVSSGGIANNTTVNSGGRVIVFDDASANKTNIKSSGSLYNLGGTISGTSVGSKGELWIESSGNAIGTVVSSGGSMNVSPDTVASNTSICSNGSMTIFSGGIARGPLQIESGAVVSAYTGAKINFDLRNSPATSAALINDWSLIQGGTDAVYSITIASDQAAGTYRLAGGANDFNETVSVSIDNLVYFNVSEGDTVYTNGALYRLGKTSDGELNFSITATNPDDVYVETSLENASVVRNAYVIGSDVVFEDDLIGGTIYGSIGIANIQYRSIQISGSTAKRFYAVGDFAAGIKQTGEGNDILSIISGSTFSGGLFMGANAVNSIIKTDIDLMAENTSSKLIMGGSNIGKQFNGNVPTINNLTVDSDINLMLTGCNSTSFCCGGSLLANECQEDRTGTTIISIFGGTYDTVAGGSLFQSKATNNMYSSINGSILISVAGDANIQTLYGGSAAIYVGPTRKETITGDITINLSVFQGAQIEKSIYVGGAGFCTINGTGLLKVKGDGNNDVLSTKNLVGASTYAAGDDRRIGDTILNFTTFSGTVESRISFFTSFYIDYTSSVNFTNYRSDFACKDWTVCAYYADHESVILSGNDLSKGKIHNIDFNNSNLNFSCSLMEGDEWTIFKVMDDNEDLQTLCNFSDAQSFLLNGEEIDWDDDELCGISENETYKIEYRFDEDENCGMLVAFLA